MKSLITCFFGNDTARTSYGVKSIALIKLPSHFDHNEDNIITGLILCIIEKGRGEMTSKLQAEKV